MNQRKRLRRDTRLQDDEEEEDENPPPPPRRTANGSSVQRAQPSSSSSRREEKRPRVEPPQSSQRGSQRVSESSQSRRKTQTMWGSSNESAEEDGNDLTQTQASQASKARSQLTGEEQERMVGDVMRLILAKDVNKIPIRRAEIMTALGEVKVKGATTYIIDQAKARFKDIYGFDLVEAKTSRSKSGASISKDKTGIYMLCNGIKPGEVYDQYVPQQETDCILALLCLILALISLSDGKLPEDSLWDHLRLCGLSKENKDHADFGDIGKLVETTFVKQLYLARVKDGERHLYCIGSRSDTEVGQQGINKFILQMHDEELTEQNLHALARQTSAT